MTTGTLPFARRVSGITGSVIDSSTSLLAAQRHDIVRFAMGSPAPEAIPTVELAAIAAEVMADESSCDYGATEGEPALVGELQRLLAARDGEEPDPAQLLVTSGGMQGLDLACKLFVDPGDRVAVEAPTYTNGTAVITGYGGELLEVAVDERGLDVDALAELGEPRPPKLIYVIPNFQNPSGVTLSRERRLALIALAERWGAVILEDDPYRELRFAGEELPGLRALAAGSEATVVSVHTFSKVLAPGLRVGWVEADPAVIEAMIAAKQGLDTCASVPMQRIVAGFLARGLLRAHIAGLRERYRAGRRTLRAALAERFPAAGVTDPDGGFFLWLTLQGGIDTEALFPVALREGVAYIPGPAFSASGRFADSLRLTFATTSGERTREGVRRLAGAVERYRGSAHD
jgi:2-aminoadipate transaminase